MFARRSLALARLAPLVRRMGGHGHGHGHAEEQVFLGITKDTPLAGFELIYGLTMAACVTVVVGGSLTNTEDTFGSWARREALARERVLEAGGEVEYGKYYQGTAYVEESTGAYPVLAEE